MSLVDAWWRKVCEPLDGFLWRKDISHPILRPVIRNQILACGAVILLGAALYIVLPWIFWMGAGMACMCWIFWSWARFFLARPLGQYSGAFLRVVLLRYIARLLVLAALLYFCVVIFHAIAAAFLTGLIAGVGLALASYYNAARKSG